MSRVAFIGLGNMGYGMARRLLEAGHNLRVYNRTPEKAADLGRAGAQICLSPREASAGVDAVIGMTADDASSRDVWLGPTGVLATPLAAGTLAIECSTLSHEWVMQLSAKAQTGGLHYIDAPVTGLPENAAAGTLTLLVGADPTDLDAARAVLGAFSNRILRFGDVGAGTAYKLIINMIGAVQIASLAEGLALAEKAGLDLRIVAEAVASSQAASPQVVRNAHRMVDNNHDRDVVFTPVLRLKDVRYALEFAQRLGVGTPFASLAANGLKRLIELGHTRENESKIIEVARLRESGSA